MNPYEKSRNNYLRFLSLTGLTLVEYFDLLEIFTQLWQSYSLYNDLKGEKRAVKKHKEDARCSLQGAELKLFFILVYYKTQPLQQSHGLMFGMSQGKVSQWIKILSPLLEQTLCKKKLLPLRSPNKLYAFLLAHAQGVLYMDATDRPVRRSLDQETQKEHYSGKHHRHTVKNTLICNEQKYILYLGETQPGSIHDLTLVKQDQLLFPEQTTIMADLGYLSLCFENTAVWLPDKKNRGKELSEQQKKHNKALAAQRVKIEHAINGVKRTRIAKDKLRLIRYEYLDLTINIASGLHNLRVKHRASEKPMQNLS